MCTEQLINLFLNIFIAAGAILAAIFSGLAYRQSIKSNQYEKLSRRAFITPSDNPGYFKLNVGPLSDEPRLYISLVNYGTNPASKLKSTVSSFNINIIENFQLNKTPIFKLEFYEFNPIANRGNYNITINKPILERVGIHDFTVMISNFIMMEIEYNDEILTKTFKDIFIWLINHDGNLTEITKEQFDVLSELLD